MTNDVPQTSDIFLDNSKLEAKKDILLQRMPIQIVSLIIFCLSIIS